MNIKDLNTALYEKMATEQEKYRDWLKSQPPEEVLNHAYEYTIREDICFFIWKKPMGLPMRKRLITPYRTIGSALAAGYRAAV